MREKETRTEQQARKKDRRDSESEPLKDKSQQRERDVQRLLLIHPVSRTTELQTVRQTRETGKKKRKRSKLRRILFGR